MLRKFILAIAITVIFGCSSTYTQVEIQAPSAKLDPGAGVLISTPEDGRYGEIRYSNSGRMTSSALQVAFSKFASRADVTSDCTGDQCLGDIDSQKYGYFVEPVILHWEDRNTEWSGKPDRIEIQVTIYDANSKSELARSSYGGKSKWATFGGDHPQDLLPEPTLNYVERLYK